MIFLCDEMLRGLCRWLRAAGYDASAAPQGSPDRALYEQARAEGRWLLTRDRGLGAYREASQWVVVLTSHSLPANARELTRRLGVDWLRAPFSRCLICNEPLEWAGEGPIGAPSEIPPHVDAVYRCPGCERCYWEGGHVRRMRARLRGWQHEISPEIR